VEIVIFYAVAVGAIATALGVVIAKGPMTSVVSLLGCFLCLAVVYLLAGFQLMAVIQLLVYAGAIMVLFLFVIMLLDLGGKSAVHFLDPGVGQARRLPLVLLIAVGMLAVSLTAIYAGERLAPPDPQLLETGIDSVMGLADLVFGRFVLSFEAAGVLLLAATVAVMVLAKRQRRLAGEEPAR
jgi:NADH-quinone oxidoreductase subunit J